MNVKTFLKLLFVFVLIVAAGLIVLSPKLLELDKIQTKIIAKIEKDFSSTTSISKADWHWLPFPYLSIKDLHLRNNYIDLQAPELHVHPFWKSIVRRNVTIGRIQFVSPKIHLKAPSPAQSPPQKRTIPRTSMVLDNATILVEMPGLPQFINSQVFRFTEVDSEIVTTPEKIKYTFRGTTTFSQQIISKGTYDISQHSYDLDIGCSMLEIEKFLSPSGNGPFTPLTSQCNATGHIKGNGLETVSAEFKGDFPSFNVAFQDRNLALKTGHADFSFLKDKKDFLINIKQLVFDYPGLILKGVIARNLPAHEKKEHPADEAVWKIDLEGTNLDVTSIREGVQALWYDHPVAEKVCDIVLAGKAKHAAYSFKGKVSDFKDVENMYLTVEVDTSTIMVPKADLHLTKAKGPIKIVDGYLSGDGLSGWLNESYGYNCQLLVGLTDNHRDFNLGLDIEGDVAELPPILNRLVNHAGFRHELGRFSSVSGRVKGNLKLGDRIDHLLAEVDVKEMRAGAKYNRLSWPLAVMGGTLQVLPHEVKWQNVKGTAGPNTILNSSGNVSWHNQALIDINTLDALIDSTSFHAELTGANYTTPKPPPKKPSWRLNANDMVPRTVPKVLTSIEGPIEIRNAQVHGKGAKPKEWDYSMDIHLNGVTWKTPLLPAPVLTVSASGAINNHGITLDESNSWFLEQPVQIKGDFNHSNFDHWHGWLNIDSTMLEKASHWVKEKGWVPEEYFPKLPCRLNEFKITWDSHNIWIKGGVLSGITGSDVAQVNLDLKYGKELLNIKKLEFISATRERGKLALNLTKTKPAAFYFIWDGDLSESTLDALLNTNTLLNGHLHGKYAINIKKKSQKPLFEGAISLKDMSRFWGLDLQPVTINELELSGHNGYNDFKKLNFSFMGEHADASGTVHNGAENLGLDLTLSSQEISNETVARFLDYLKQQLEKWSVSMSKEPGTTDKKAIQLNGIVKFRAEKFHLKPDPTKPHGRKGLTQIYTPLAGFIKFSSLDQIAATITQTSLCGIPLNGMWYSDDALGPKSLRMWTDLQTPPKFQEILPCLGSKQSLIEGDVLLDVNFEGNKNTWLSGHANIYSKKGYIHRLALLSKIFSVINITDLFKETGLQDAATEGFAYSSIEIETQVEDNNLIINKAVIRGDGLNLFARGKMDLKNYNADITILISPFKSLDAIVTKVPIVGRVIGGENATIITIPVSITGNIRDPQVKILKASAVGEGIINLVNDIIRLPYFIIEPILPKANNNS